MNSFYFKKMKSIFQFGGSTPSLYSTPFLFLQFDILNSQKNKMESILFFVLRIAFASNKILEVFYRYHCLIFVSSKI